MNVLRVYYRYDHIIVDIVKGYSDFFFLYSVHKQGFNNYYNIIVYIYLYLQTLV